MTSFRTSHFGRVLAGCLAVSMLLTVLLPLHGVGDRVEDDGFSDWLRSQVALEHDESFEEAIEAAANTNPESLPDFLIAFVDAHPAPQELAALLGASADVDLLQLLQGSSERLGGIAVLPRTSLAASVVSGFSLDRLAASALLVLSSASDVLSLSHLTKAEAGELIVFSYRLFSDAQPLGP